MHIFLTGPIQIGKSTLLQKVLAELAIPPGGFLTQFQNRSSADRSLHLLRADAQLDPSDRENIAAQFRPHQSPLVYPTVFDTLGVQFLQDGAEKNSLIVMDELGFLEQDAPLFQKQVLQTLANSPRPVFGVLKEKNTPWLSKIKNHPRVETILVTKENRDDLLQPLVSNLRSYLS